MNIENYRTCPKCKKKYHVKTGSSCPFCSGNKGQSQSKIVIIGGGFILLCIIFVIAMQVFPINKPSEKLLIESSKEQVQPEKKTISAKGSNAQIVCNKFNISARVSGSIISLSINTDLPDNTVIMISAFRSYWINENSKEHRHDYFSKKSTAGQWKSKHKIIIDSKKWTSSLRARQEKLSRIGIGFEIASISDKIEIRAVVPINQPNPRFGKQNSKLIGDAVTTRTSGFRVVEHDIEIDRPMASPPIDYTHRPSLDPLDLDIGQIYITSKKTPLMPTHSPVEPMAAAIMAKQIPAGGVFKVLETFKKGNILWYRVAALDRGTKQAVPGWIHSGALLGQNLKTYK